MTERECGICGRPFVPKANQARYCSKPCRVKAKKTRQKIWYQNSKPEKKSRPVTNVPWLLMFDIINDIPEPFINHSELVRHATEAKAMGLSYGYYMAFREGRL